MISYAPALEDVLLHRALHQVHFSDGFYIDVGATHPSTDSVTKHFYEHGWRGINVKATPSLFSAFVEARQRDINLNFAVSEHASALTSCDIDRQWSAMDARVAQQNARARHEFRSHTVPACTLTDICNEHVTGTIHFLRVDIEGHQDAVLRGMDFKRYRPWILVIKAAIPNGLQVPGNDMLDGLVRDAGYTFVSTDALNRYYVADEHLELAPALSLPADEYKLYNDVYRLAAAEGALAISKAHDAETISDLRDQLYNRKGALARIFYKEWHNEVEFLDGYLRNVTGIIHVGANTGQEREFYQQFNIDVIWVEPIEEVYGLLSSNIRGFERQKAIKALLTDRDGEEYDFHIANNGGASSSIQAMDTLPDIWPDIQYVEARKLVSTTLEKMMLRENISPSDYQALTMDVEGAELLVLKGAGSMLARFKYVKAEVADFTPRVGSPTTLELDAFLGAAGFEQLIRRPFGEYRGGRYWDIVWKRKPRLPLLSRPPVKLPIMATDASGAGWDKVA